MRSATRSRRACCSGLGNSLPASMRASAGKPSRRTRPRRSQTCARIFQESSGKLGALLTTTAARTSAGWSASSWKVSMPPMEIPTRVHGAMSIARMKSATSAASSAMLTGARSGSL